MSYYVWTDEKPGGKTLKNFLSDIDLDQVQEYYRTNDHSPVKPNGKIGLHGPYSAIKTLLLEIIDGNDWLDLQNC